MGPADTANRYNVVQYTCGGLAMHNNDMLNRGNLTQSRVQCHWIDLLVLRPV